MLVAGIVIAAWLVHGVPRVGDLRSDTRADSQTSASTDSPPGAAGREQSGSILAMVTANVYATPTRDAEVIAILPAGQSARPLARNDASSWVSIAYPPSSTEHGWVRASALAITATAVTALPVSTDAATMTARDTNTPAALPDLTIGDAFLLQENRLAIAIRNVGSGPVTDARFSVQIGKLEGDLVSVVEVGPTTIGAGGSATVVTPVTITTPGSYRITIDVPSSIGERLATNNTQVVLLVPRS